MKLIFLRLIILIVFIGICSCISDSDSVASTQIPQTESIYTPIQITSPPFTLSPFSAQEKLLSILKDIENCVLPCFLEITPKKNSWEYANNFLSSFAENVYGINRITPPNNSGFVEFFFDVPEEVSPRGELNLRLWIDNGFVAKIQVPEINFETYQLGNVMKFYGKPDEIWISTFSSYIPLESPPFTMSVYYAEKGIILNYDVLASWEDDLIRGCINNNVNIYLWQPLTLSSTSFIDAYLQFDEYITDRPLITIENATNTNINSFYDLNIDNNLEICLVTPRSLWPDG